MDLSQGNGRVAGIIDARNILTFKKMGVVVVASEIISPTGALLALAVCPILPC